METVARQLDIPRDEVYNIAEDIQTQEKRSTGKKRPIYEILVDFLIQGAKHYSGDDQKENGNNNIPIHEVAWNDVVLHGTTLSKVNLPQIKQIIVKAVEDGHADPCEVVAKIAAFEKVFLGDARNPGVKKMLTDQVLSIVEKSNGSVKVGNFEISSMEGGTKYDFGNDPVWEELSEKVEASKELLKNREIFLKGVTKPDALKGIEPQTELYGDEVIELRPPVKTSTTTIKVSLK